MGDVNMSQGDFGPGYDDMWEETDWLLTFNNALQENIERYSDDDNEKKLRDHCQGSGSSSRSQY